MGLFDRFKKKKEEGKKEKASKQSKKTEARLFDPSKVPSGKEEKKKVLKEEKKPGTKIKAKKEDTADAYRVLLRPLLTEKAANLGAGGKYLFEVGREANKIEIKKAIRSLYGVKALKVNIINERGKNVLYGRNRGKTKDWKKAQVTLRPGEKIEISQGG